MKWALFFYSLLCSTTVAWGAAPSDLDQGNASFAQGRYPDALQSYQNVIAANPRQAEAYFQMGLAHAAQEQYDAAAAAYRKAIDLEPEGPVTATIHRELGIVYFQGMQYCEAAAALQKALSIARHHQEQLEQPDFIPGVKEMLQSMKDTIPELAQCPAKPHYSLTVMAKPPDSTIKVLNIQTPYSAGMTLSPGQYAIEVSKPGYETVHRDVTIRDTDIIVPMTLAPVIKRYMLTVQATPADSLVEFLNIQPRYPPEGIALPPGSYYIQVSKPQYETVRQWVMIRDSDVTVPITLPPAAGAVQAKQKYKLTVQVNPADSELVIWNIETQFYQGMALPPGRYDLSVEHKAYQPVRQWVEIRDRDTTLEVTLEPLEERSVQNHPPQERGLAKDDAPAVPTSMPPTTYKFAVHVDPADSQVELLNVETPYRQDMALPPGRYDLHIQRDGYQSIRQWIEIRDRDVSLNVALEKQLP